ncbi:carbon storage regulator [Clostridium acetobutylicum]|uniref:Translational regulator CsrA n=1 Tax=Clostridium acetobutylicum (strain ATCC 824 / DSM 792 / JCM 1419 / IAM 19013 / LMG 5710 / NBRC 13948 / NRRL B-527 / VKM B-1787 / 2291 / W) TaxID=272562 RepID=CSRA_CLOAB|nr:MULTISPECIES: carbon storage regulator CsrA [Clostridium]Q97H06.1 RecName: Full=Translational regulator CsrA [Clostridium acetobutylicum ATCC 824]AAK80166.1 Carbon storage regulator, csrA [Clostridium acetobutylicum ATCC 824]ADZ21260.1 Carbon storage regulator, csrA [Clostridium acetobutylicum EA 2018]AEI34161.1 carbon storage regulator, csrA [Clostridium acetobutylicum DSM 1731]AWV79408.1 carbon storage regulator [Clostridium acetobutylicum]KHD38352.1 carbon storage regulator [Clostridium
MLVMGRKKGESILIGDDIEITIVSLDENSVKIAINAPREVTILRKELYNKIKEENKEAVIKSSEVLKELTLKK